MTMGRPKRSILILAATLALAGCNPDTSSASSSAAAAEETGYLPLGTGSRWELKSRAAPNPMTFEVIGQSGDIAHVRWVSPWFTLVFGFRTDGKRVLLTSMDSGQGEASMPPNTVYFDFGAAQGASWRNEIGNIRLRKRGVAVSTPTGKFDNSIEFVAVDKDKTEMIWVFAPGTGFVQFGEGKHAFYLTSFQKKSEPAAKPSVSEVSVSVTPSGKEYLPLSDKRQWQLNSPKSQKPILLEVLGREADAWRVKWDNPWFQVIFHFASEGQRVLLTAMETPQGTAPMASRPVYFDFSQPEGARWKNEIGEMQIVSRNRTVSTPTGKYTQCIEIKARDENGTDMHWFFAQGVGLVQFGTGADAFLLSSVRDGAMVTEAVTATTANTGPLFVGIEATPPETDGMGQDSIRKWFAQSVQAGATQHHISPKWNEVEKTAGKYDFGDLDFQMGLAKTHKLPVYLNVRVIDTGERTFPTGYESLRFNDSRISKALSALLTQLGSRYGSQVRWLCLGNEVDGYLLEHSNEIADYRSLLNTVLPVAKKSFNNVPVMVNFTFGSLGQLQTTLKPLADFSEALSLTYYPLNPDFTARPPSVVPQDIQSIVATAGVKPIILQEVGYPSSPVLKSSPAQQAQFVTNVLNEVAARRKQIVSMNYLFMSDLPKALVDTLAAYYQLPNSGNFKAYLETLGLFDRQGKPKPAWEVFRRQAAALKGL